MSQITNSEEFTEKELKENIIEKMEFIDGKVNELSSMKHENVSASDEDPVDEVSDTASNSTEEVPLPNTSPFTNINEMMHQAVSEAIMTERASYMNRYNRDKYEREYKKTHNVIKDIIEKWCLDARVKSPICYNIDNGSHEEGTAPTMIIYTTEVEKLLGYGNKLFDKYSSDLNEYFTNFLDNTYIILVNPISRFVNLNVYEGPDFD